MQVLRAVVRLLVGILRLPILAIVAIVRTLYARWDYEERTTMRDWDAYAASRRPGHASARRMDPNRWKRR